jgi:hypothetical protein
VVLVVLHHTSCNNTITLGLADIPVPVVVAAHTTQ